MSGLDHSFLRLPLAHRGLHNHAAGCIENSPSAFAAAISAGYGIELDVQMSADGQAMVFHDDHLDRLTDQSGAVRARRADALGRIRLLGSSDTIPTLAEVLDQVRGRAPLLIEIKDQDGALGPRTGPLEHAVAEALAGYAGPLAVMSFNPHSVAHMADYAPHVVRGLTTCAFTALEWRNVPRERRRHLANFADFESSGSAFVSHERNDLDNPHLSELRKTGVPILTWTIRSPKQERAARQVADNITFEGYAPAVDPTH
jgi:glycerophosphoryl diester phosphodiesterase